MGNSQLQPAHFNKRAHHKKRGGANEIEGEQAQADQAPADQAPADQAPAEQVAEQPAANDKNCPCPCPSGEGPAEKLSVAQQAENKVKEGQAALIGAVTGKAADTKNAVVGKFQDLVGKANALVGNEKAPAAAAVEGGGRRTRKHKRKHTKRSRKHKKVKRSRKDKKAKRSRKPKRK
jgi:hypothetical protein